MRTRPLNGTIDGQTCLIFTSQPMRYLGQTSFRLRGFFCLLLMLSLGTGCRHAPKADQKAPTKNARQVVETVISIRGKVALLNEKLRYVVLDLGTSRMPEDQQRLNVYHGTQKVAEIKVSGPSMNNTVTADIIAGQPSVGDEVRPD
jgi:hypothetical protein